MSFVVVPQAPAPDFAEPARQRVVLHVGLPKTGTTYLQALLAGNRDRLRQAGVLYPFIRPGAMFHGAVEVRGSHAKFGLAASDVAGTWRALCDRARSFPGTTVISHEVLAGATPAQVATALEPLEGLEVEVVVTARDLGRQVTAHWQEEVKLGDTRSFADFEREQFRADTGPDEGPDAGGVRPHFWHAQDFADALARWSSAVPVERVHLVICPAPGAPPAELWRRFAEAAGIDPGLVDPTSVPVANPSLGAAEILLLRAVNTELDGRLPAAAYHQLVKRGYAEAVLAGRSSAPPRAPKWLGGVLEPVTRTWLAEVRAAGYPVHGDLVDLAPVVGGLEDRHPDDVPAGERLGDDPAALARAFLTAAQNLADADAETGQTAGASSIARRGVLGRIRNRLTGPDRA